MQTQDLVILRDLAKRYHDVCADPLQRERRDLWRRHNSLERTRPLIYVRAFAWNEMPQSKCACEDPFLRQFEDILRNRLFWSSLGDDSVFLAVVRMGYFMPGFRFHFGYQELDFFVGNIRCQ